MTTGFQKYEFQELAATTPAPADPVQRYQEPKFESHQDARAADLVHRKKEAFHLDKNVAGQLGLDERRHQEQEAFLQKEIERRWEQMSEKAEVTGYTKGLEEGKKEAFRAEQPRIRERLEKFDHVLQEIDKFRDRIFSANEAFLMDIVSTVAGMIVLKEIEVDKDYVRRLVVTLLHHLGSKDDVKISLSEVDFANVEMLRQAIEKEFGKLSNTTLDFSPEIQVGGCKIETRFGVVDASVASQLENIRKAIKG